ncbi:hypothetical protein UFOVP182_1 [uncultured Caudovirales phage]|uniref:GIY-YIG domain-containing protein n=1 Tax=uncultured Caudovirales phage TaxID=2100421 RepID=A0A6J7WI60_9CAUD|nr:hypothetical protein UFOVP182_1 [uncultured Caudovirales phage]
MKRKLAGIYKIEHSSGYYYIGMSVSIFERWQSHYTSIKINKHSSTEFMNLWNSTKPYEWTFSIIESISITEYKKVSQLKGKELEKGFRQLLLRTERNHMSQHSITWSLNKDKKYFS